MRLELLEVHGFGRLRDARFELAPGLTVLLGENEAGKSTVHRAIRAALYGIDAGGQGRPVERTDWARWVPWSGGPYGVALTYVLSDGRRFRVARRLEDRGQPAQVVEVGGRDVTDAMRVGRVVAPAQVHLGIDETVFCASACLAEDGLRPDAPDGAGQRSDRVQEAIERLADSASRATAGEALARLRDAAARIGTERRAQSPLGVATARLRRVEIDLDDARRRSELAGAEQDRLHALEAAADEAERRRCDQERAWLVGRLAALAAQRREVAAATGEAAALDAELASLRRWAGFPVEREPRVLALGGELTQAVTEEREAAERWDEARARLRAVERRRVEIATSLRALGRVPRVGEDDLEEARRLGRELDGEAAAERRAEEVLQAEARCQALRREIAGTGLAAVPVGSADTVAALLEVAGGSPRERSTQPLAIALVVIGAALGAASFVAGIHSAGLLALAVCLGLASALVLGGRFSRGPAASARRELARRCPGLDVSAAGLARARERLPALRALHNDLQRREMMVEAGRAELESSRARLVEIAQRCLVLAARIPVEVPETPGPVADLARTEGLFARSRAALHAVEEAAGAGRRRAELEEEDGRLLQEESVGRALRDEAERRSAARSLLDAELAGHLEAAGLSWDGDAASAIAAFSEGCGGRRRLDEGTARLVEVRRRLTALGSDDESLARLVRPLSEELRRRGGDPDAAVQAEPLDPEELQALEVAVESARHHAEAARAEARGLRERIAGMLDSLPAVADLEDERAACVAARERMLRQLEALARAGSLIENAARRVHRDVAPKLARSVGERLVLLTDGRYDGVNVDAERFAVSLRSTDRPDLVPLHVLSHGTRDQVSLLLRLALVEVFGEAGETAPLLLDDPLLTADLHRRRTALEFLVRLAQTSQVVMTTADPAVAMLAERIGGDDCAVLVVPGPRAEAAENARMAVGGTAMPFGGAPERRTASLGG